MRGYDDNLLKSYLINQGKKLQAYLAQRSIIFSADKLALFCDVGERHPAVDNKLKDN